MQHYWLLIFLKFIIISFFCVFCFFFCGNAVEVFLFRNRTLTDRMSIRIYFYPGDDADDDEAEADEDDDQAIQRNFPSIHT